MLDLPLTLLSLSQTPQLLQSLWEDVSYGIFVLDVMASGELRYAAFNPAIARISPIPVAQLLGQTLEVATSGAFIHLDRYRECMRSGQSLTFTETCVHNGQPGSWLLTVNPLRHPDQSISQLLVTVLDISEPVAAQLPPVEPTLASAAKFRHLVEAANDVISIWGLDGRLTYLSPSFQTLWGYAPTDWLDQSLIPLMHPDDLSICRAANQQVAATGEKLAGIEFRLRHQQGHWLWLSLNISPVKDQAGTVIALQGILRDISDRKQGEAKLHQSQQLLQQILDTIPILIFWKDQNSVYQGCNQLALAACGLASSAAIVGKTDYDLPWTTAEADYYRLGDRDIITSGQAQLNLIETQQRPDGRRAIANVNKVPLHDAEGNASGILITIEDISTRQRYENALRFIAEGTIATTGTDFFCACVQHLTDIFQVKYAFITELVDATRDRARMLTLWTGTEFIAPYEFDLVGAPCQVVFQESYGIFPASIQQRFPAADALATLNAESYLGVVIVDAQGQPIGNLGIIDIQPLTDNLDATKSILQLFATRVGAEMQRKAAETALQDYADRQTLLNQLANQIHNSLDLDTVIATTLASIRELLDIDNCAFAWYDFATHSPHWNVIQEAKRAEIPSALGSYPATFVGVAETIFLNQEVLQVDDVNQYLESAHRDFLKTIQVQSEVLLPIRTHAKQFGVIICINHTQVRPWTTGEVELLKAVSDQLAIAIDQAALYTESQAQSQALQHTLKELQQTQAQVLQSEKMSSLGQLVAGIAHEINNPVNFIHGNLSHANSYAHDLLELVALYQQSYPQPTAAIADHLNAIDLDFLRQDLAKLLTSMQVGTERIREIVKSLRSFSRLDEAEVKPVNIHEGIDSTLMILQNRIKDNASDHEIKIIKHYGKLPEVECFAGKLNQVFMNVLANAIDAVEESSVARSSHPNQAASSTDQPTIHITTAIQGDRVAIRIADNGTGIPAAIQAKIFDPFFTTKPVGKGTGMGLSISYQIITDKHGGEFSCHSTRDQGTEFLIQIPIRQCVSIHL